jgi:hypothetical protein
MISLCRAALSTAVAVLILIGIAPGAFANPSIFGSDGGERIWIPNYGIGSVLDVDPERSSSSAISD